MRRWFAILLMTVLLPWQAVGWASTTLTDDQGADEHHAVAHWSGEAHHHHANHDQPLIDFHEDDSDESIRHIVQSDAHLNAPAVLPLALGWLAPLQVAAVPAVLQGDSRPSPFLEGLRRPPRSLLIL